MKIIIGSVISIYICGSFVDWFLGSTSMEKYRRRTFSIRQKLAELDVGLAIQTFNAQFLYLFKVVYGEKFWSLKRIIRSIISSLIAVGVISFTIVLLAGETKSPVEVIRLILEEPAGSLAMFIINLFADYFSLQETNWIIQKSQGSNLFKLIGWTLCDLFLTSLIYGVVFLTLALIYEFIINVEEPAELFMYACFLSTYVTSLFWIGFFFTSVTIKALKISSPLFRVALNTIGTSEHPGRTTAGLVCIMLIIGYFLIWFTTWGWSSLIGS